MEILCIPEENSVRLNPIILHGGSHVWQADQIIYTIWVRSPD